MIHDTILNDLWAVMEDNPNNPNQLLVIADRYQEIHDGFAIFSDGLRWLAEWRREPIRIIENGSLPPYPAKWVVNSNRLLSNYKYRCQIPPEIFSVDTGFYSIRQAYEVIGFIFFHLEEITRRRMRGIAALWSNEYEIKAGDFIGSDDRGRAVKVKPGSEKYVGICRKVVSDKRILIAIPPNPELIPIERGDL